MQYSEGSFGRVFILRIDDAEDLLESIQEFVKEESVESGMSRG
jgi:predicted DNA-binding protein with PD1-like motif